MRPGPEEVQARPLPRASSGPHPIGGGMGGGGGVDKNLIEKLRRLRSVAAGEDIDEIVRWQMTGLVSHRTPGYQPQPRCGNCKGEWHGLPHHGCPGSHLYDSDTPGTST